MPLYRRHTLALLAALASAPPPALAETPRGVAAVLACRSIAEAEAQLRCFRKAADGLVESETPVAATAPAVPRAFGAPRPRPTKTERPAEPRSATLVLTTYGDPGDGRITFGFADGSTWKEIEPDPVGRALKAGQSVTLERGLLGATFLDIPGRASVRVARLR